MTDIFSYLKVNQLNILKSLEVITKAESPSLNKQLVDGCGQVIQNLFYEHVGLSPEVFDQKETGNHLKFSFGSGHEQILVTVHFDTVWDKGCLPFKIEGERCYGPGVLDIKSGVIQTIWALKAIKELQHSVKKKIVVLCTSDEEIGSQTSRDLIEAEAKKSIAVLVPEAAVAKSGALKTGRKGVGRYTIKVKGVSAHAGNHHRDGINAVEELAHQIVKVQNFTDYDRGTTVNVGSIYGGGPVNVVPDQAEAKFDVRISSEEEAKKVEENFYKLEPILDGTELEVVGGINRLPMEKNKEVERLFGMAKHIAGRIGFDLKDSFVGGGSDGNFTAALGVPTLDGLGGVGEGPHAVHEHVIIKKIPERTALLAHLFLEI
jgi:glutamate carboxypeptidase